MYENNILFDAYYLINKYNQDGKEVTNLKIQKVLAKKANILRG